MKSLKESLATEAVRYNKFETPCQLVSTRNSNCSIFLGPNFDQPYDEDEVKKICKDMGVKFRPIDDFFDEEEMEDLWVNVYPGAVIEDGRLIWYDMADGTVDFYKL